VIRFDNVSKVYLRGARPALDRVTLEIDRGEFTFLVGASGSGKSTMLSLVLRQERPSSGSVWVLGQNVGKLPDRKVPFFRRQLGCVFQDFRLLPGKTVFENVAFAMEVIGQPRHSILSAVPDVLQLVGLAGKEKRLPHELSGGEQQRVAIARAVVNRPQVLLADEPTGNLDPQTSEGIMAVLDRVNQTGTTILMATHDVGLVNQMRRRVIELDQGEVVRDETGGRYGASYTPISPIAPAPPVTHGAHAAGGAARQTLGGGAR
jgi:cell division transport system ATP-binding protein